MTLRWSRRGDITGLDCDPQQVVKGGGEYTSYRTDCKSNSVGETESQRGAE